MPPCEPASQWPSVDSMALGFYQEGLNGQRIISHGGDIADSE